MYKNQIRIQLTCRLLVGAGPHTIQYQHLGVIQNSGTFKGPLGKPYYVQFIIGGYPTHSHLGYHLTAVPGGSGLEFEVKVWILWSGKTSDGASDVHTVTIGHSGYIENHKSQMMNASDFKCDAVTLPCRHTSWVAFRGA